MTSTRQADCWRRIGRSAHGDAVRSVLAGLEQAFADSSRPWWVKRIRSGRDLDRCWEQMLDELTLDKQARKSDGITSRTEGVTTAEDLAECSAGHSADCVHVRRVINAQPARDLEPHQAERNRFAAEIARELNERKDEDPEKARYFASLRLRELITNRHKALAAHAAIEKTEQDRKREEQQTELRRLREANGGTMLGYTGEPGKSLEVAS